MEDLNDLIFYPENDELWDVDPSTSLESMADSILHDINGGFMEPISNFDNLEDCINQDGEPTIEKKESVISNSKQDV